MAAFRGMHVSPAKHSYAWLPRKSDYQESVTTGQTDGQTDAGQSDPYVPLCFAGDTKTESMKMVAAFRGMDVSPAKHSYVWLPRKCNYQTDRCQTKWSLYTAMLCRWHKKLAMHIQKTWHLIILSQNISF